MTNKYLIVSVVLACLTLGSILIIRDRFLEKGSKVSKASKEEFSVLKNYNIYVKTNKETVLYKKEDNSFNEYGKINKDVDLTLEERYNKDKSKYYKLNGLDLYVYYKDVKAIDSVNYSDRYKNYIPYNKNVKTNDSTILYDDSGNYVFAINDSLDSKIIVMDTDRYGIEFANRLLYVKSDEVKEVNDAENNSSNKKRIRTLTYHLIYNPEKDECKIDICQSLDQLESHLKYIRENDYFTLKLDELELYMAGKINIPEKSIVLTIDDGTVFDLDALKLLEKYQTNMTLFVITSMVGNIDDFKSDYLDLESHTDNMHNQYECPGYGSQGGGILCLPEEQVLNDLKTSQDKLGGSTYLSYPFFDFSERAISLLKKAGFKLAFIGQYDTEGYSYPGVTDPYKMRRMTIFSDTTMDEFIEYLK